MKGSGGSKTHFISTSGAPYLYAEGRFLWTCMKIKSTKRASECRMGKKKRNWGMYKASVSFFFFVAVMFLLHHLSVFSIKNRLEMRS